MLLKKGGRGLNFCSPVLRYDAGRERAKTNSHGVDLYLLQALKRAR
jgi:hypothetical protein